MKTVAVEPVVTARLVGETEVANRLLGFLRVGSPTAWNSKDRTALEPAEPGTPQTLPSPLPGQGTDESENLGIRPLLLPKLL